MHAIVDSKIKTLAWNSHARIVKAYEACHVLKKEYDEALEDHVEVETELRHQNIKLENEIADMISRFDESMFDKHHEIDNISVEYAQEKVELLKARVLLDETETEKEEIIGNMIQIQL